MTKTQAREGHQRFVELAQAIGAEGWTGMEGVAA